MHAWAGLSHEEIAAALGIAQGTARSRLSRVAAAVIAGVMQGPPTLTGRLTTSWESARPLPGSAHPARVPSGAWRLMSYLVARGWQENTAGPEPGRLTCPTAATCYVEGRTGRHHVHLGPHVRFCDGLRGGRPVRA
jgi:sigma-70-like protein